MIDRLRTLSLKIFWLKPISYVVAFGACWLFGYVVLYEPGASKDVYLIPSVVAFLWSVICISISIVSFFPYVPAKSEKGLVFFRRIKVQLVRFFYHLVLWVFIALSLTIAWLSFRLINVWYASF